MEKNYINLKILGIIIVSFAITLTFSILSLTDLVLKYGEELHKTCPLPEEVCPIKRGSLPAESIIGLIFSAGTSVIGFYLFFLRPLPQSIKEVKKFKSIAKNLKGDEKKVYEVIINSGGSVFQGDIISKTGLSKVRVSRILDKLEIKGLIEKRRRGMANLILLKE